MQCGCRMVLSGRCQCRRARALCLSFSGENLTAQYAKYAKFIKLYNIPEEEGGELGEGLTGGTGAFRGVRWDQAY